MLTCYLNSFREAHDLPDGMHVTCIQFLDDLDLPTYSNFILLYLHPFISLPPNSFHTRCSSHSGLRLPRTHHVLSPASGALYILFFLSGTLSSPPHMRISRRQLMCNRLQKALLISHCWLHMLTSVVALLTLGFNYLSVLGFFSPN